MVKKPAQSQNSEDESSQALLKMTRRTVADGKIEGGKTQRSLQTKTTEEDVS